MAYASITVEGGLFPQDLLERVAAGETEGQRAQDFGADGRLSDRIQAAFSDARSYWDAFHRRLKRGRESPTTLTREDWVVPLLADLLGYQQVVFQRSATEIGGQSYAVSHRAGPGEHAPPVHIVGFGQPLDTREENRRRSPHAMVQELLNRSEATWGIVTNGARLRLLRDSVLISRPAYVEFDLETMVTQNLYSEFVLFYRLLHATRLPRDGSGACLLESYYHEGIDAGGRVREKLREGVEAALVTLGNALVAHPESERLRARLESGALDAPAYYRQLLRLVYRLLFLMVAEERRLLFAEDSDAGKQAIYTRYYAVARLRDRAERQFAGDTNRDLWAGLLETFRLFREDAYARQLGLAALDGELFGPRACADLEVSACTNEALLTAFHGLSTFEETAGKRRTGARRRVNYAHLDVEEFGSVYESLLDFHPRIDPAPAPGSPPRFALVAGSERKQTGSYYTPPSLVKELVESALVPVMEERLANARKASGEWRVASGGAGGSRESRRTGGRAGPGEEEAYGDSVVPGPGGLAGGDDGGGAGVPADAGVSARGTVRADQPGAAGGGLGAGEYRGGVGASEHAGVPPVPPHRTGEPPGAGDARAPRDASRPLSTGPGDAAARIDRGPQPPAPGAPTQPAGAAGEGGTASREWRIASGEGGEWGAGSGESGAPVPPLATRYSLLASEALLSLRVCDPASGSGHFLLAAARRIARELAKVRSGEDEPAPAAYREALRDVIRDCVYAVDRNPLAVDLCKVALWLEGHTPGRPLSFLDHHVKCGDSLVGVFDLEVLREGVPDDAYRPVTGDDRGVASAVKARNKQERLGQMATGSVSLDAATHRLAEDLGLFSVPEKTAADVQEKEKLYQAWQGGPEAWRLRQACDAWTAAFFAPLVPAPASAGMEGLVPTTATVRGYVAGREPHGLLNGEVRRLADANRFFHWPLEFPDVFDRGGFDVVLGNPPWEQVQLDPREFFATRSPEVAAEVNMAARDRAIATLRQTDPALHELYGVATHAMEAFQQFVHASGRFPLTSYGRLNTAPLFAELVRALTNDPGRGGVIVPTGIATDSFNQHFFSDLVRQQHLVALSDFENSKPIFESVHRSYKFSLLTITRAQHQEPSFAFFLRDVAELADPQRRFTLTREDFALLNPNTGTCPILRTRADADLTRKIYRRVPVLVNERTGENPWGFRGLLMFMMNTDSGLFRTAPGEGLVPLYEAKLLHQFDHRWATYAPDGTTRDCTDDEKRDPAHAVTPRYWVPAADVEARLHRAGWDRGWLLGWRDIARATDERTVIASAFPRFACGDTFLLLFPLDAPHCTEGALAGNLNSLVLDYAARQKVGGTHLKYNVFKQLPVLTPSAYTEDDLAFITPRVLELTYTAWDLQPFARDLGYEGPPFAWDPDRRAVLRAELDARYAALYGLTEQELRYILDPADVYGPDFPGETFRVLKQREIREYGEYRTRRLVLEAWGRLGAKG